MQNPSNLDPVREWVKTALAYLGGYGGLATLLYFLLKKSLERTVDSRFDARLEKVKHQLQLEQQKMSVVYENQKDSFRKVLVAMNVATESIERKNQGGGDWRPISQTDVAAFSRVAGEEALFLDGDSDQALRLSLEIMWKAATYEDTSPTEDEVWRSYNQMKFISDRLASYFRTKVGLKPGMPDPMRDIEVLGACCLLNRFAQEASLPANSPFRFRDDETAAQVVSVARENSKLLKAELKKLQESIRLKNSGLYFESLVKVTRYIDHLSE